MWITIAYLAGLATATVLFVIWNTRPNRPRNARNPITEWRSNRANKTKTLGELPQQLTTVPARKASVN